MVAEPIEATTGETSLAVKAVEDSLVVSFEDIVPKRVPVLINGRELSAYVWNKRCPRSVRAQVFDAYKDAQDPATRRFKSQTAQENCTTKSLMAMVPGLGYVEADALQPEEVATLEIKIGLRSDPAGGEEPDQHPQKGGTTTPSKRTGARSSSDSRQRSG